MRIMPSREGFLDATLTGAPKAAKSVAVAVTAACFAALVLAAFATPGTRAGRTDFLSYYAGARLAGTADLYSPPRVYAIQQAYGDPGRVIAFTRLPYQAALLWPLGQLPYRTANVIWQLLNLLAVAGFVRLWAGRLVFVPLCCLYFPMWVSFHSGQDVPLVLVSVAVGGFLLRKNRHFAAGLAFALCAVKFHLFLLLPLLIVGKSLWRFAAGFLAGALAEAAVSLWAGGGWDWPVRYSALLRLNESSEASAGQMLNLKGLLHGLPHEAAWLAVASAAVVWGTWRIIRRSRLEVAIGAMLCGGLLVGLHGYMVDAVLLLPLFVALTGRLGLEKTFLLSALVGFSTAAASSVSTAFVAQFTLAGLFVWLAILAPVGEGAS